MAPVRPGSTLGVVSVRLSRSLFVPGRQLKRGGSPPFPPALGSHTRVATKRRVGFRSPASHTRVATARAERDAPTPMCFFFFCFFFCNFFFCIFLYFFCIFFFFFFLGGGRAVRGVWGWEWGFSWGGGGVEGEGLGVWVFWGEVMGRFGRGEELGVGVFSGGEVLGSGFWCRSFGVGLWVGLGVVVGCGLGVAHTFSAASYHL